MRKEISLIGYALKGELVGLEDNIMTTQVTKKDSVEEDNINLEEMLEDIKDFCDKNANKNIEFKLTFKKTEE